MPYCTISHSCVTEHLLTVCSGHYYLYTNVKQEGHVLIIAMPMPNILGAQSISLLKSTGYTWNHSRDRWCTGSQSWLSMVPQCIVGDKLANTHYTRAPRQGCDSRSSTSRGCLSPANQQNSDPTIYYTIYNTPTGKIP